MASDSRRHDPGFWVPQGWPGLRKHRPWRILLPFAGGDAPGRGFSDMSIKYKVVGAWEIDEKTGAFLLKYYAKRSDRKNLNIGSAEGDLTKVKALDVADADGLIAGPPCPPWSASGGKLGWKDKRARGSKALFALLRHLCRRKRPLRFFIIENVRGILGKKKEYLDKLRAALPKSWSLAVLLMNSHCLAQTRPRVYLVGWKSKKPLSTSEATKAITAKLPHLPRRRLSDMLLDLPNDDPKEVLTAQQCRNFRKWMRRLKPSLNDKRKRGMVACFEADRDPDKTRATLRVDDLMMTLRAAGHPIWVISLGEKGFGPSTSRLLAVEERCLLQGFSPSTIPQTATAQKTRQVMGNAMTVPVVGSVVGATLLQLQEEDDLSIGSCSDSDKDARSSEEEPEENADDAESSEDDPGSSERSESDTGECSEGDPKSSEDDSESSSEA